MLNFNALSLRRGTRLLFRDVTFTIHRGSKLGLTGANGTGKTSFLQLVLGELSADSGNFEVTSDLVFACVSQETAFGAREAIEVVIDGDREFRDLEAELANDAAVANGLRHARLLEAIERIGGYSIRARAARLMQGLGFREDQLNQAAQEFSGGWRMRLNLAKALLCRSDVLLLDEPTNHLDLDAVIWLQDWLKNYAGTLILISHDREFLDEVTDHIAHIENQCIKLYTGNYSSFEKLRADQLAQQESLFVKQQREVQHMRAFIDRFRAKASKAKQAQSRLKALQRMELIVRARSDSPFQFAFRNPKSTPDPLVKLSEIAIGYANKTVLDGIELTIRPGDRIGLLGPNGAGKSTLIKLLAGEIEPIRGTMGNAKDLDTAYFAQHQLEQLRSFESPLQHFKRLDCNASERDLRNFLGGFAFSGDHAMEPVAQRSGGEKTRLILAMLAYGRANLLLLDEPTNHLDIQMRDALSLALQEYRGALVLVSHDRYLLRILTDRFYLVNRGKVLLFDGDLDDYRDSLKQHSGGQIGPAPAVNDSRRDQRRAGAEKRGRLRPLRVALDEAESNLHKLEKRKHELEEALSDIALYTAENHDEMKSLLIAKSDVDRAALQSEEVWLGALQELEEAEKNLARSASL
ncbi:MAG: ATP-binding cassette domain-containing protein [Methylococcales bacterium]